jgi:gamma-glutamyltranspeptidase/glutathione hydrolase
MERVAESNMIQDSTAKDRSHARSMVITQSGVIATSQTLASQAGAQVLARGGSCIDAAIAANAVLSVVEPMMCGLGGDLFAIYRDGKTGALTGINASGYAPKALTLEYLNSIVPTAGIHSVTVPGGVDGWAKLHGRFGKLPWADLFQPAIYYADRGFPLTELIQYDWEHEQAKLTEGLFLRNGHAPHVGEIFRNPQLGSAYRILAKEGPSAVYHGEIAAAILRTSQQLGGTMSAQDLQEFSSEWIDPISTTYRGWDIYQIPPNGQGIGALEMLNIMENFDIPSMDPLSAKAYHLKIETQKLAFADQRRYIADLRFSDVPIEKMLSKDYAARQAATIGHTIYLAAADRDGNLVSFIQSISDQWGSGVVVDDFGFHLHNRGSAFSADPSHPNALAPRKRPYHTIIPGFMQRDHVHIAFGIMRGLNQAQAHAQFVSNVVDHGMNIQAALEAPRFTKMTLGGRDVRIEGRVPLATREELKKRGHDLEVLGDYSGLVGGGQAIMRDSSTGVNYGASSPRKDGAAIPEPDPYWS